MLSNSEGKAFKDKTFLTVSKEFSPPSPSPADPGTTAAARLSRAEAYMALKQYRLALEDTEFCPGSSSSAEVGH